MKQSLVGRLLPILFVTAAFLLHWRLAATPDGAIGAHRLLDTDSYTRLLRVEELWQGNGWYDTTVDKLGAPEGLPIHWTRPLDVMILLPAMAAHALGAAERDALWWSGMLICPILHAFACLVGAWAARARWGRDASWFAAVVLLAQPMVLAYGGVGRADHHILILLCVVGALGAALRAIRDRERRGMAWAAGAMAAAGVWVGPEAQLVALPVLAAFGLSWLVEKEGAGAAVQGLRMALGLAAVSALGVLIESRPADWLLAQPDKISIIQVATAVFVALVFAAAVWISRRLPARPLYRLLGGGVASIAAVAALSLLFPGFEQSSLNLADPVVQRFVAAVSEMQPLRIDTVAQVGSTLLVLGGTLLAPLFIICIALASSRDERATTLMLAATLLPTLAATILHRRFAVEYAAVAALVCAGGLVFLTEAMAGLGRAVRAMLTIAIVLLVTAGVFIVGARFAADKPAPGCPAREIAAIMVGISAGNAQYGDDLPVVINNDFSVAPRLAYETPFRFIVSPYHRDAKSMNDTVYFFLSTSDFLEKEIVKRRNIEYVLFCNAESVVINANDVIDSLGYRLSRGEMPPFLEKIYSKTGGREGFTIYRVR